MSNQLYSKPVALNSKNHRDLKLAPVTNYRFAKDFNSCIVLCQEFLEAAKSHPIVFSKVNENLVPMVLLGINNNMLVDENGKWADGAYVPAFFRRYPFILAEGLSQDGSLTVCIDSAYEGFDAEDGQRLFTDHGENAPALKRALDFLQLYQTQFEVTKAFINHVNGLNIFKSVDASIKLAAGKQFTIKNLWMVDEQAMLKLDDAELLKLVKSGFLAWIYAHLYSITNFAKFLTKDVDVAV